MIAEVGLFRCGSCWLLETHWLDWSWQCTDSFVAVLTLVFAIGDMSAVAQPAASNAGSGCSHHQDNLVVEFPYLTGNNVPWTDTCGNPHHIAETKPVNINSMCITYLEPADPVVGGWDCGGTPGWDASTILYHRAGNRVDVYRIKLTCQQIQGLSDRRDLSCPEP